jgi:hypothetical protein
MASDHGREIGQKRRRDRLAASLRENLKRRKAQQHGRAREIGAAGGRLEDKEAAQDSSPSLSGNLKA